MILGYDVSGHQGAVNFAAGKAAGRDFVVLKATEGIGWTDPTFAANRAAAHAAGLIVGIYHFASAGVPTNEAAYFCGVVGQLQPGEFLVLDWETAFIGDHVAWCRAWLDAVAAKTGVNPFIYMNQSEMNSHNWAPIASTYGLWLARYDGSTAQPAVTSWSAAAMKQYSDAGSVLGVSGGVDVDVFYGTTSQLLAYGYQGADMPLTDADAELVAAHVANRPYDGTVPQWECIRDTHQAVQQIAAAVSNAPAPTPVSVDAASFVAALKADPAAMDLLAKAFAAAAAPAVIAELGNVIRSQSPAAS